MSSPVSSRRLANLVKESLQGSVLGGVVSDAVLPAVSDDVKPGADAGSAIGGAAVNDPATAPRLNCVRTTSSSR